MCSRAVIMVRGRHFSDELVRDSAAYFSKRAARSVSEKETRRMLADHARLHGGA